MGCINSTKKLHTAKGGNFYKVSLVGLQPDLPSMPRCGILELRPFELVFTATGKDPFKWALQHLRRYGLNGNIFSFETGRRCKMGPRIYMFRCCNADMLHQKFQRYVNCITAERNRYGQVMEAFEAVARNEYNTKANHYLQSVTASQTYENLHQQHLVMDQTDIVAIPSKTEEKSLKHMCGNNAIRLFSKKEHGQSEGTIHDYTNISLTEDELKNENKNSNNINCIENKDTQKDIKVIYSFKSNADTPISPIRNIHFYGYINEYTPILANEFPLGEKEYSTPKHFYENLIMGKAQHQQEQQCSSHSDLPAMSTSINPTINYIVLDLHKSTESNEENNSSTINNNPNRTLSKEQIDVENLQSVMSTCNILNTTKSAPVLSEACRIYSSIDFVKTCALNKSCGNSIEFDAERDNEEFRITRHSKSLIFNNRSNLSSK